MKFYEVIYELTKDKEKAFTCESKMGKTFVAYSLGGFFFMDIYAPDGEYIPQEYEGGSFNGHVRAGYGWEEVDGKYESGYLKHNKLKDDFDDFDDEGLKEFAKALDRIFKGF